MCKTNIIHFLSGPSGFPGPTGVSGRSGGRGTIGRVGPQGFAGNSGRTGATGLFHFILECHTDHFPHVEVYILYFTLVLGFLYIRL